jgi:hypothetical protein
MIYKDIVNTILRRLREDEVGTVNENAYSKLVGAFVNDAKKQIEDSWQWLSLQETVTINTEAGIASYDLEDYVTDTFNNAISDRARVWLDLDTGFPVVACTTAGKEKYLGFGEATNGIVTRIQQSNSSETGEPTDVFFTNNATSDESKSSLRINFTPTPDGIYTYKVYIANVQPEVTSDTTDIRVPASPIIQLAYLYCLYERGEEVGEALTMTAQKAENSLGDAISFDMLSQGSNIAFSND